MSINVRNLLSLIPRLLCLSESKRSKRIATCISGFQPCKANYCLSSCKVQSWYQKWRWDSGVYDKKMAEEKNPKLSDAQCTARQIKMLNFRQADNSGALRSVEWQVEDSPQSSMPVTCHYKYIFQVNWNYRFRYPNNIQKQYTTSTTRCKVMWFYLLPEDKIFQNIFALVT